MLRSTHFHDYLGGDVGRFQVQTCSSGSWSARQDLGEIARDRSEVWYTEQIDLIWLNRSRIRLAFLRDVNHSGPSHGWYLDPLSIVVQQPGNFLSEGFENGAPGWSSDRPRAGAP